MPRRSKPKKDPYPKKKFGYYGQLGQGARAEIKFVQTAIERRDLADLTLIQDIHSSERWDVRDLFQRDVDDVRVQNKIMPWMKDAEIAKFFNPLTLLALPYDSAARRTPMTRLRAAEEKRGTDDHGAYRTYELANHYRLWTYDDSPEYSKIEWNDDRVDIVAIDGQHRLSALKRWDKEPGSADSDLDSWTIPVVILTIFAQDGSDVDNPELLEIVRRTFVNINSQAITINDSREILLDDSSVNAICTQELIQASHSNDVREINDRNSDVLPLLFFDWRGEMRGGREVAAPAAVKSTREIRDWMEHFILGEDGDAEQREKLGIDDITPPLDSYGADKTLSHLDAKTLRTLICERLIPGLQVLLQDFRPYRTYIEKMRATEAEYTSTSDLKKHAYYRARFGHSNEADQHRRDVEAQFLDLVDELTDVKDTNFHELIGRDIGMRAVVYAFAYTKGRVDEESANTSDYKEHAEWFVKIINTIYDDGYFQSWDALGKRMKQHLNHIVYDDAGNIINYKFKDVTTGFGPLLAAIVITRSNLSDDQKAECWDDLQAKLKSPLRRGFKKAHKKDVDEEPMTNREKRMEVNRRAEASVEERLSQLGKDLHFDRT